MSERLLLVEDDDSLRYAMSRELAAAGFQVAEAHDYRDALEVLENGTQFALLLVDLVLPQVNGFALARMARLRDRNIKLVYMTGYRDIPTGEADGPLLQKPIAPGVLVATVRDALGAA